MNSLGRKLLITGKGRCNITSSLYMSEFIKNTPGNGRFLYSAFQNYTNTEIGKIATQVSETEEEKSPLTIRIEKFSKQISVLIGIVALPYLI